MRTPTCSGCAAVWTVLLLLLSFPAARCESPGKSPVKVFVLAGQSNMVGAGAIKMNPRSANRGKGTLEYLARDPVYADQYAHLLDEDGNWIERDDVWILFGDRKGELTAGYGGSAGQIGPEFQFGHVIGDYFENQVLLIKCAWGGKSLAKDFRPPSAGGEVGAYYTDTMAHVKEVLQDLKAHFPEYDGRAYEFVGFGWHQGWNDRVNQAFSDEYESNLVHFIRDLRKDLGVPGLPFVIAETGMGGLHEKHPRALSLMKAQADAVQREEFKDNAAFVGTRAFWRTPEESPSGQGYHWNSNAETYCLIGEGLAEAMIRLLSVPVEKSVLETLSRAGSNEGRAALCRKLMADNPKDNGIQSVCLGQLVGLLGTGGLDDLIAALGHENRWLRRVARKLAVELPGEGVTGAWLERLGSSRGGLRTEILRVLAGRRDPEALPAVRELVGNEDEAVRVAAVRTLSALGGADVLSSVTAATLDENARVRATAFALLVVSTHAEATDVLLSLAEKGEGLDQHAAALRSALRRLAEGKVPDSQKAGILERVLAAARRPDEKRLALAELRKLPTIDSLRQAQSLLRDAALREDAAEAAVAIAESLKLSDDDERKDAALEVIQSVFEKSKNRDTRDAAEKFIYKHKRPDLEAMDPEL